jgi:hypothetical protein
MLNREFFPPFSRLPDERDVDEDFYDSNGGMGVPRKHWCLVGTVKDVIVDVRMRALLKTSFEEMLIVHFYLDRGKSPTFFKWTDIKPGKSTMCILYPVIRNFMDMTQGIRVEDQGSVAVFPCTESVLRAEVDMILKCIVEGSKSCCQCGKADAPISTCSKCKVMTYCGRDCQKAHWTSGHKKLCAHAPMLTRLARFDMSRFEDFQDWSFSQAPEPEEAKHARHRRAAGELIARVCPGQNLHNLRVLLEGVGERVLMSDPVISNALGSLRRGMIADDWGTKVKDTFLYQALLRMCDEESHKEQPRVFVVDQKLESDSLASLGSEMVQAAVACALPVWQSELGLGSDLAFFVEDHNMHVIARSAYKNVPITVHADKSGTSGAFTVSDEKGRILPLYGRPHGDSEHGRPRSRSEQTFECGVHPDPACHRQCQLRGPNSRDCGAEISEQPAHSVGPRRHPALWYF